LREHRISARIGRIDSNRLARVLEGLLEALGRLPREEVLALEQRFVGLWVDALALGELALLLRRETSPDLTRDGGCHVVLQSQDVSQVALVGVRPEVPVLAGVDE